MAGSGIEKAEYSCSLVERFRSCGGRMFLVDYSKSCAAKALLELIKSEGSDTFLMIAENAGVATEFQKILKPALGDIKVVGSYSDFRTALGNNIADEGGALRSAARDLPNKFKNLIIAAKDVDGKTLFNKEICDNKSKGGTYTAGVGAKLCISDLLCESGYSFVAVDNVYGMFSFTEGGRNEASAFVPGKHDRIDFLGRSYYCDTAHSYKRLQHLIGAADKCVIISDVVVGRDAAELYAALELIESDFSIVKTKRACLPSSESYNEECERVCTDISYCREDDSVISGCLQRTKGAARTVPSDIDSMKAYFANNFRFMSEEETFLRTAASLIKLRFGGKCPGMLKIIETLENDTDEMMNCFCDIFFGGKVKGELESFLSTPHVADMSTEELEKIFRLFLEHGVYHYLTGKEEGVKVIRLKRDDSGFEYFVRRRSKDMIEDEYSYSIISSGSDITYKCAEIARLADGRDSALGFKAPALVVVKNDVDKVIKTLHKMLPDYTVVGNLYLLDDEKADKVIIVADYDKVRSTALWLNIGSAVFLDVTADVVDLKLLINKTLRYGEANAFVVAGYGDMSGHVMDKWQQLIKSPVRAMPINNSEMSLKDGSLCTYKEITDRLEAVYKLIGSTVRAGCPEYVSDTSEKFNDIISDYTLRVTIPTDEIVTDVEYLARVGRHFEAIFRNTCSVGDAGDVISRHKIEYAGDKNSSKPVENVTEDKEVRVFFNACARMLRHDCNLIVNNCADCPEYDKFKKNSFEELKKNIKQFFDKTLKYDEKMEEAKRRRQASATISSTDDEDGDHDDLVAEEIKQWYKEANDAIAEIESGAGGTPTVFSADYAKAEAIRNAVYRTYRKMLRKYYITVRDIFNLATEKALTGYRAVSECVANTHNG